MVDETNGMSGDQKANTTNVQDETKGRFDADRHSLVEMSLACYEERDILAFLIADAMLAGGDDLRWARRMILPKYAELKDFHRAVNEELDGWTS